MGKAVLVDTGFWLALVDPTDGHHPAAIAEAAVVDVRPVVVPWPLVYETFRTRLARNPAGVRRRHAVLTRTHPAVVRLDDAGYRQRAFDQAVASAVGPRPRPLSLVDVLCRLVIADPNVRIRGLPTFNPGDFADVCSAHGVELL